MKLDGTELRDCTPDLMYTEGLSVAPNGQMVFSAADRLQNIDIYSCPVDGSAPPRQLENSGLALSPELSPDGRHVTWLSNDEDRNFQVFEAKVDGSGAHPVTHGGSYHTDPHYLADGNTLVFLSNDDGKTELYRLDLDPSRD
jgi:TolB protein